jgi:hypothetical protein
MGTVYRKTFTKPLPAIAEVFIRKGERFARWKDSKGKPRTAKLTTGNDGADRLLIESGTFTAKYRTGTGLVVETATGCRDETAARRVLGELERRGELVKSGVMTAAEDAIADHQSTLLEQHFDAFDVSLQAKGVTKVYREDCGRYLRRVAADCRFTHLSDMKREAFESWLAIRTTEGMSARSRNAYRETLISFCNWCVGTRRLLSNPFSKVSKANQQADPRRQRRSQSTHL